MSLDLHVERHGEGETVIAVCNGLSQTTANWRGLARANPHYHWLLFDARGHGKSPVGPRPYSLDDHVDDLIGVLDREGVASCVLMGFSHGARVSLRAAAEHGARFAGVVLVSCASRTSRRRRAHVASWRNCLELGGLPAMAWASLPNIVGRKILERFDDLDLLVKGSVSRNNEEGLRRMFEGMATYPAIRGDAERVEVPVLILRGEEDGLVDEQDSENLAAWIENAVSITFPECGHTLPLEEAEAFMKSVEGLIARL